MEPQNLGFQSKLGSLSAEAGRCVCEKRNYKGELSITSVTSGIKYRLLLISLFQSMLTQ
jgi:hypothetical protein